MDKTPTPAGLEKHLPELRGRERRAGRSPEMRKPRSTEPADIAETQRLLEILNTALQLRKIPRYRVAKALGHGPTYMSRLLNGSFDARLSQLLEIARYLGLQPAELFQLAYPESGGRPGRLALELANELEVTPLFVRHTEVPDRLSRRLAGAVHQLFAVIRDAVEDLEMKEGEE